MSMKNKDTWEFAHKYCGKVWYVCGMVMLPITVIFMLLVIGKNVPMEKLLRKIVQSDQNLIWGDILKKKKWFEIDDINDLQIAEKIFV